MYHVPTFYTSQCQDGSVPGFILIGCSIHTGSSMHLYLRYIEEPQGADPPPFLYGREGRKKEITLLLPTG